MLSKYLLIIQLKLHFHACKLMPISVKLLYNPSNKTVFPWFCQFFTRFDMSGHMLYNMLYVNTASAESRWDKPV